MNKLWIVVLLVSSSLAIAAKRHHRYDQGKENYIKQVFQSAMDEEFVALSVKDSRNLKLGTVLNVYRWAKPFESGEAIKIKTGEVKVSRSQSGMVIARVTKGADDFARSVFQKFPGPMAGDEVELRKLQVVSKVVAVPEISIPFHKLFMDPSRFDNGFELSDAGMNELQSAVRRLSELRVGRLIIGGHTDASGRSDDNQLESLQRAQAIRHILVDKFGFDGERVVALGFGETEPLEDVYYPGIERVNRRIVIKATNH